MARIEVTARRTMADVCAAVALAFVLGSMIVGCGGGAPGALRVHAGIAQTLLTVQAESGPMVRRMRVEASVSAGAEVHRAGGTETEAHAAAEAESDRWTCAVEGHRAYADAVGLYIDALAMWQATGASPPGTMAALTDAVGDVADAYRGLSRCLGTLGHAGALPGLPDLSGAFGAAGIDDGGSDDGE